MKGHSLPGSFFPFSPSGRWWTFLVFFAGVTGLASRASGWGAGHVTQARMVLDGLPKEIREFFPEDLRRKIVGEYCFYPDTARSFDQELLGRQAVEELKALNLSPSVLHDDQNIAVSFLFLTRAFAEKNPRHAAVWLGSLIHTIGDDGSHLTLTAYLSEFRRFRAIKIGEGCSDLSQAAETPFGRAALARRMAGYMPRPVSDQADVAMHKMVLLGYEQMDFGAQRQSRIGQTYNVGGLSTAREDGIAAMAELGAEGVQRILDATLTAWQFAQRGTPLAWTEDLRRQARADVHAYLQAKPLEHDTVYAGTLQSRPQTPFVGVLVEPSTFMGRACFGYCGAVLLGQTMRTFQQAGVPYAAIDLRTAEKAGLPSADAMPVLVVVSGGFSCNLEAPFRQYAAAGGRLLWIGGRDKGMLGELSRSLAPADPKLLPVSNKYEDPNTEVVTRVSIRFLGTFQPSQGEAPRKFINNPNTFGWTTPRCGHKVVTGPPGILPLVAATDGTDTMTIGAALVENGRVRHVFLPHYLLLPFTLAIGPPMDFSQPTLDDVGKALILDAIRMLR